MEGRRKGRRKREVGREGRLLQIMVSQASVIIIIIDKVRTLGQNEMTHPET